MWEKQAAKETEWPLASDLKQKKQHKDTEGPRIEHRKGILKNNVQWL